MRFIRDDNNRLLYVSFGADITCDGQDCTEYVGAVPEGYASLESWYIIEQEKLYRWTVVDVPVTAGDGITVEYALVVDENAVAPTDRSRLPLNDFNPWREYMENDQEGYHHVEPYYGSDGETGFLIYNGDKVYVLQLSSSGLLLRYYNDGQFIDYTLDGYTAADGVGVAMATVNEAGHLIMTLSDDTTIDCGMVKGDPGKDCTVHAIRIEEA